MSDSSLGVMDATMLANAVLSYHNREKGFCFFILLTPVDGKRKVFANPGKIDDADLVAADLVKGTLAFIEYEESENGLRVVEIHAFHKGMVVSKQQPAKTVGTRKPDQPKSAKKQKPRRKPSGKKQPDEVAAKSAYIQTEEGARELGELSLDHHRHTAGIDEDEEAKAA